MNMPATRRYSKSLIVPNAIGLHARPAAMLVKTAQAYKAEIVMTCGHHRVNVKSIMSILTLGAEKGTKVTVTAEGHDAEKAIRAIEELFTCCFHEEESESAARPRRKEEQTVRVSRRRYGVAYETAMSAAPRQ